MQRRSRFRLRWAVVLGLAACTAAWPALTTVGAADAQARLLVKFAPGASSDAQTSAFGAVGGRVVSQISDIGVRVVSVPAGNASSALAHLKVTPGVEFAEPDATAEAADVPNDPYFSQQWGLNKIDATDAWTTDKGSASVKVAILDTGVSLTHPDLQSKIVSSVNFSSSSTVDDVNGHGSHVAGIAAAMTNNGVGVAGLGYNADILNVKVLDDSGMGLYSDLASGITWAADNGADVINMSLGGTTPSSTLESAVNYAWSKGVVVVAAAGNNSSSTAFYPAAYSNVIAVAATDSLDHLASFSDYGDWVDVAAPGVNIYSTIPSGYGYMSGTSMASPYVAGLAGLLFANMSDTNGDGVLNDEVRAQIQNTADNVGVAGIGSGRIDAYRAVTQTPGVSPPVNTSSPSISGNGTIGQTLQASTGAWTNSPTGYAYQWQRCDANGANCAAISGATLSTYLVASADVGSTLRVQVTASNSAGSATATSAQTAVVAAGPPQNTGLPLVSGTAQDGQTLQTTNGTWTNSPTGYAYQWQRCDANGANCANVAGATSASYPVTSADVNSTIRSTVTATNSGGSTSAQSAQTAVVVAAPPVNTVPPTASGSPSKGQTLTTSNGSWKGTTPMSDEYQWLRCDGNGANCASIAGATASIYTLTSADVGSTVRSNVTASNSAGSASANSSQTAVVTNVQNLTFSGTLTKNTSSLSFPITIGAGEADATLTFSASKSTSMTLKLMSGTTVAGQTSGSKSPLTLNLPGLSAGSYTYVVSGSGYKGSVSFALTVTAPGS
jgi:thermitase